MSKNHYETLGVSRDASDKDIRQAFRSLSMKYHPDKVTTADPAEQEQAKVRMQEINEAYEILGDDASKQEYNNELDGIHANPFSGGPGGGGFPGFPGGGFPGGGVHFMHMNGNPDIGNIFEMLFSQQMGGGPPGMFFHPGMGQPQGTGFPHIGPPPTIVKTIEITLPQAYTGHAVNVDVERWVQKDNQKITETEKIGLNIPAGIEEGMNLLIKGKGNAYSNGVCGDIKFVIQITNNTPFRRVGNDLYLKKQITLKEALCGFQCQFVHLNGKTMGMNNTTTIIFNGAKKNINGLGMTAAGSLIVEFDVVFPTELSSLQREALTNIL
jgi:DnaJ-class molecular chaperone